jgi:uncharacterized protein YndB with AHSA1/START domain
MNAIRAETRTAAGRAAVDVEAILDCPRAVVFAAFSDARSRAQWCAPPGADFRYLEATFAVGARDVFECLGPGGRTLRGEVRYEGIAPDQRIVYTETLFVGAALVSSAAITVQFEVHSSTTTRVTMSADLGAGTTPEMVSGYTAGLRMAMEGLRSWLTEPSRRSPHAAPDSGEHT